MLSKSFLRLLLLGKLLPAQTVQPAPKDEENKVEDEDEEEDVVDNGE